MKDKTSDPNATIGTAKIGEGRIDAPRVGTGVRVDTPEAVVDGQPKKETPCPRT